MYANNALTSKAKAMYGLRLRKKDYDELVKKQSVSEIASYLKNETAYKEALKDIRENMVHRGQLELLIQRESFMKQQRLVRYVFAGDKEFYELNTYKEEIDQILSCIKAIMNNDYDDFVHDMPLFMSKQMTFDFNQLLNVKNIEDFKQVIVKTRYGKDVMPFLERNPIDYTGLTMKLRRTYYERMSMLIQKQFHGKTKKNLMEIFDTRMELSDICKIYRMKEYFHADKGDIQRQLLGLRQRINEKTLQKLLDAKDGEEVLAILESSPYHLYTSNEEFIYIEYYCHGFMYHLGKRFMYFSSDAPVIYLCYTLLDEIEVENIIAIIEGVRYNVEADKINKLILD